MTGIEGTIIEDVTNTIAIGQKVFDKEGKRVGTVDYVYRTTGYALVETNPFSDRDLYIPFNLITSIDQRELYVGASKDELKRDHAEPPPRTTRVIEDGSEEVAITTEP